ncbi:DUF1707 SHOCT-like domain-containing protein [Aestuariimicrobium ganziense]|uniref:DUF1707 SHOCT-like domain-containing protein n=1 Tax=Aestuariimicrobium ganziense TaxID=2773677 RepID=UPI001945680D|nr:DUF1707 domain-containing protein [Aestuariimicrobium ganziense]
MSDDRHLRVGTAQREHALELVREAAADGRLEYTELDSRVARALGAVTRDDLAMVLDDLVPSADLDQVLGESPALGEGPGYRWERPLVITSAVGQTRFGGDWLVPPFLEVHAKWNQAKLDFTHARSAGQLIDLVLVGGYGTLVLIVPEGWGVDVSAVMADQSSTVTSSVPTRPTAGHPRIVVRGRTSSGVRVRPASRFDKWQGRRKPAQPPPVPRAAIEA